MKMILHPYSIVKQKEYYRMISSAFVHNDLVHLLLNEAMIYGIGGNLEQYLRKSGPNGSFLFLFIYVVSGIFGALITTIRHRKQFDYSSAGASASILGIMMSFMILQPNYIAIYLPFVGGIKNIYTALFVIAALMAYQKKTGNPMINHEIHFFGALGGILVTLMLFPQIL